MKKFDDVWEKTSDPLYNNINSTAICSLVNASNVDEYLIARTKAVWIIFGNVCRGWSERNGTT